MFVTRLLATALLTGLAYAHGDVDHAKRELEERRQFLETHTNNLDHCEELHVDERAILRRAETVAALQQRAGLDVRQLSTIGKSHSSNEKYNASTSPKVVFGGKNACVLSPETTEGPFYVSGESIRSALADDQVGVPLYLDIQVIDVNTCKPVPNLFLEIWTANATGVYSGALSSVNGNYGMQDKANLNKGFLRGAQRTDEDGVVQFSTIFPGHYQGRATHLHVISHVGATPAANNTIWNTRVSHIGQAFFDQALIDKVEKLQPYSTNRQPATKNSADSICQQEAATADPFFNYVQLGDDLLKNGLFAWFSFGINTTYTRGIMAVANKYKEGGQVATNNPKLPGFSQMFPGGFPTSFQPGFGPSPTPKPRAEPAEELVEG